MGYRKNIVFLLVLAFFICLAPVQSVIASPYDEILAHNTTIYNAAETGDNARQFFLLPSDEIESADAAIIALAGEITRGYSDDFLKARAIHDWVCNNIWGDLDYTFVPWGNNIGQSALDTLSRGYAVCRGYANLTAALLRASGIPAKYVIGLLSERSFTENDITAVSNHAWTEALIGGRWIIIDSASDSGNRWQNGRRTVSWGMIDRKYFNISLQEFSRDHRIDDYRPFMGAIVSDDGALIRYGGIGNDLPDGIVAIESYAFQSSESLTRLTIPDGIEVLGRSSIANCRTVRQVTLPVSLRMIDLLAFDTCISLESIHIPNGIVRIGTRAFYNCRSLSAVYIPPTVISIYEGAFYGCPSLSQVVIPSSVETISSNAFGHGVVIDESGTIGKASDFTVYGSPGSAAEDFARQNDFVFIALTATPVNSAVLVNGDPIAFDAYNIAGNNYFKLRDLAYILSDTEKRFSVSWDEENQYIGLYSGIAYVPVGGEMTVMNPEACTPLTTTSRIFLDGREISLAAYNINGNNFFKLRDIGEVFNFGLHWDEATQTITIDTTSGYLAD